MLGLTSDTRLGDWLLKSVLIVRGMSPRRPYSESIFFEMAIGCLPLWKQSRFNSIQPDNNITHQSTFQRCIIGLWIIAVV